MNPLKFNSNIEIKFNAKARVYDVCLYKYKRTKEPKKKKK